MEDIKQQILKVFDKQPLTVALATIDENVKPWVRYMAAVIDANTMQIRTTTFTESRKVKQIAKNPEVHLACGMLSPAEPHDYLQIQGRATFTRDETERQAMWNDDFLQYFPGGVDDPNYGIMIIAPYRIELMPVGSMQPEVWQK